MATINKTGAYGTNSHAEGYGTIAYGSNSHAEGYKTIASGPNSHAEGDQTQALNFASHAEGSRSIARGSFSHAEGVRTLSDEFSTHAEGYDTTASGYISHAEGYKTTASGSRSHAEGYKTTASGAASHSQGRYTTANGDDSHSAGYNSSSNAHGSYAYGANYDSDGTTNSRSYAEASGIGSWTHGYGTSADTYLGFAHGFNSHAKADYSFVSGRNVDAYVKDQKVMGVYNLRNDDAAFIYGLGDVPSDSLIEARNGFEIFFDGRIKSPMQTFAQIKDLSNDKSLTTREYVHNKELSNTKVGNVYMDLLLEQNYDTMMTADMEVSLPINVDAGRNGFITFRQDDQNFGNVITKWASPFHFQDGLILQPNLGRNMVTTFEYKVMNEDNILVSKVSEYREHLPLQADEFGLDDLAINTTGDLLLV